MAEQQDPGFAGNCRETCRVVLRAIFPNKGDRDAAILSALVLAHMAGNCFFLSVLHVYDDELFSAAAGFAYFLYPVFHLLLPLICAAAFVLRLVDGESGTFDIVLRNLPLAPLRRLGGMVLHVTPLAISYTILSLATFPVFLPLHSSNEDVALPQRVIGGAACLTGAAYASVVLHIACVVTVLERGNPISHLRRSLALLAGNFWAAATIFVPLDTSFVALQVSLLRALTSEGAGGLGWGLQVAAGTAMTLALGAVVVATLAAQPVVYLLCNRARTTTTRSSTAPAA